MVRSLQLLVLIFVGACGSLSKMALRSQATLFENGSLSLNSERDWQWFKEASPGNIQFMETMLSQDPDNQVLRRTLIRAYAGYAYSVFETEAIPEHIRGDDEKPITARAVSFYRRALAHGEYYFANRDINFQMRDESELQKKLESKISEDELTGLLFFAQAWAGLINLQKHDMSLLAQLPRVKLLFDYVCKIKPDIEQGVCPLFYAQYEASRPRIAGGNPVLGAELFQKYIERNPKNLLARVNYLQFSVIPRLEEEEFSSVGKSLEEAFVSWEAEGKSHPLNLYNAIAKKRWEILKSNQKAIF